MLLPVVLESTSTLYPPSEKRPRQDWTVTQGGLTHVVAAVWADCLAAFEARVVLPHGVAAGVAVDIERRAQDLALGLAQVVNGVALDECSC